MKRSGPPKRRTPLVAKSGLARSNGGLKRTAMKRTSGSSSNEIPSSERTIVERRSGKQCEARIVFECTGVASHVHHRKLRRHRDHRAVNLLHLCGSCHAAVHNPTSVGLPQSWSYDNGYLLHANDDPAEPCYALARRDRVVP